MRTHLLPICGRLLGPLVLVGCQEATTDPEREGAAGQSAGVAPAMSPAIAGAEGQSTTFHFVANGNRGFVQWFTEPDASGNTIQGLLSVGGGGGSKSEVFLTYIVVQCDASDCVHIESGFGPIPVGDLTGNGINKLTLNTNTSTNPSFTLFAGAGGLITLEWVRVPGGLESRVTGSSKVGRKGLFSTQSKGTITTFEAKATGSVVTFSLPTSHDATLGTTHNLEVQHTFNP
jgi:hypothetical protein